MPELSDAQKREIIAALEKKGANLPCPRCGTKQFTLLDGYFNQPIQVNMSGLVLGGPTVPSAVVVCTNCGFIAQHALGAIGLLQKESGEEVKK